MKTLPLVVALLASFAIAGAARAQFADIVVAPGCQAGVACQALTLTETNPNIGAVSTDGVVLQNLTAAANGAQQFSPRIRLTGQGWKTTAAAASQSTDITMENQPVQGTTNPIPHWMLNYDTNGGALANLAEIYDGGAGQGTVWVMANNGGASQLILSSLAGTAAASGIVTSGGGVTYQANRPLTIQTNLSGSNSAAINLTTAATSGAGLSGANINLTPGNGTGTGASNGGSVVVTPGTSTNGVPGTLTVASGDQKFTGSAPVPTGTGTPTMATGSTDSAGEATSGATATSLIITFAKAKTNAPFCTVTPQTQLVAFAYTISTTAITITQTATSGEKIDYVCFQH